MTDAIDRMAKTVDAFHESIRCIRSGGVTTALVDSVKIDAYGQQMPIKHLAVTSGRGDQPISVRPHDPSLVPAIVKELSKQGLNAYAFSRDVVCVNVPPVSGEDKERTRKHISKLGEEAKIAVRNLRKQARKGLSGTEDEVRRAEQDLQNSTDEAIEMISEIVAEKIARL